MVSIPYDRTHVVMTKAAFGRHARLKQQTMAMTMIMHRYMTLKD